MDFNELCKDFDQRRIAYTRRSGTETAIEPLATISWDDGNTSSNDLLRRYLIDNGIEYINNDGTVWFLWGGEWTRSKVRYDHVANIAHFSRCIFA